EDEPYLKFAREIAVIGDNARGTGKTADLAFQYQGGIGAWRRLAGDDVTPDATIQTYQRAWRQRHPNIRKFWDASILQAVKAIENRGAAYTAARTAFRREGDFLRLELPSGRGIHYPFARPYEDRSDEERTGRSFTFRDASGGRWAWYHVLKKGRSAFGGLI